MITMGNFATQAVKKLESEKGKVAGQKEKAMAKEVFAAIKDFCVQKEEFAQVVAKGGSFADCMKKVAAGVGQHISDLEAYKRAVKFYIPGADVHMELTIIMPGESSVAADEVAAAPETTSQIVMELKPNWNTDYASYFDF